MADGARWDDLWRRLGARGDPAAVHEMLSRRYGEPHRAYHTLGHIARCLAEWDEVRDRASSPAAAELAIWFHDVVCDPRAGDNERRSADLASEVCRRAGLEALAGRVEGIILDTRHQEPPATPDGALVADVDLAILGGPPGEFASYEASIRREYAWVSGEAYRKGRAEFLEKILSRRPLFRTEHLRAKYEEAARRNIGILLGRLNY